MMSVDIFCRTCSRRRAPSGAISNGEAIGDADNILVDVVDVDVVYMVLLSISIYKSITHGILVKEVGS